MSGLGDYSNRTRMAKVIRSAILEEACLNTFSETGVRKVANRAMHGLVRQDISRFIYQCFNNGMEGVGIAFAEEAIEYAIRMKEFGKETEGKEALDAAIGTLAILSTSSELAKKKVAKLLEHPEPMVLIATIENVGHSSNIEHFKNACNLLLHDNPQIQLAAAKFVEACTRDAAFRKREKTYAIAPNAEKFLREGLVPLEETYGKLTGLGVSHVQKRIAILVAMIYNEILDSMEWRRIQKEEIDDRIYYALEGHLHENIGPAALPLMLKMLKRGGVEGGIEKCALNTLGRMSNSDRHRGKIVVWLKDYLALNKPRELLNVAAMVLDAQRGNQRFSSIPAPRGPINPQIIKKSFPPPKLKI